MRCRHSVFFIGLSVTLLALTALSFFGRNIELGSNSIFDKIESDNSSNSSNAFLPISVPHSIERLLQEAARPSVAMEQPASDHHFPSYYGADTYTETVLRNLECTMGLQTRRWRPARCPDDEEWIAEWAVGRGLTAQRLALRVLEQLRSTGAITTKKDITTNSNKNVSAEAILLSMRIRAIAIQRLLSWTMADVGANKGYLLAEVARTLLHHKNIGRSSATKQNNDDRQSSRAFNTNCTPDQPMPFSPHSLGVCIMFTAKPRLHGLCGACCDCVNRGPDPVAIRLSGTGLAQLQRQWWVRGHSDTKKGHGNVTLSEELSEGTPVPTPAAAAGLVSFQEFLRQHDAGERKAHTEKTPTKRRSLLNDLQRDPFFRHALDVLMRTAPALASFRPQRLVMHGYEPMRPNYRWLLRYFGGYSDQADAMPSLLTKLQREDEEEARGLVLQEGRREERPLTLQQEGLTMHLYRHVVGGPAEGQVKHENTAEMSNPIKDVTGDNNLVYFPIGVMGTETGKARSTPARGYAATPVVTLDEHLLPRLRRGYHKYSNGGDRFPTTAMAPLPGYNMVDILVTDCEGLDIEVAKGASELLGERKSAMGDTGAVGVAAYMFEMPAANYSDVFGRLSHPYPLVGNASGNVYPPQDHYSCYFPTQRRGLRVHMLPRFVRATHGCFKQSFNRFGGWMNAMCSRHIFHNRQEESRNTSSENAAMTLERFLRLTDPLLRSATELSHLYRHELGRVVNALVATSFTEALGRLHERIHFNFAGTACASRDVSYLVIYNNFIPYKRLWRPKEADDEL